MVHSKTVKKHYRIKAYITKTATAHFDNYDYEYNPWKMWEQHLQKAIDSDLRKIKSETNMTSIKSIHDEKFFHFNIHNPMFGTLIVAIYSEVENCLKKIFNFDNYDYKCLKCKLKQYKIDDKAIPFFNEINILRLKANAYKHNDLKVTKELAEASKEKEGEVIDYTSIDIKELIQQSCEFLWFLEKSIKGKQNATK